MPSNKKNVSIPIIGGIDQSVDGFVVAQSNRIAENVIQSKDGIVSSGLVLEKVAYLGDDSDRLNSVVESHSVPIAAGYSGYLRMDNGIPVSETVCPAADVSTEPVSQRTRYPSNAHAAVINDNGVTVQCVTYMSHDTNEQHVVIRRNLDLPLLDVSLGTAVKHGRVLVVADSTMFGAFQDQGKVFVVIGGDASNNAVWRVYSPVYGTLISVGTFAGPYNWDEYSVCCSFGDRIYFTAKHGAAWRCIEVKWASDSTVSETLKTLSTISTEPNTPLSMYAFVCGGERTIFWITRSGEVQRASFESVNTGTYSIGKRYHLASIGMQITGKIVVVGSFFERVGGVTAMTSTRPIFGDLNHFGSPPASPETYHQRVTSDVFYININAMTLSSSGTIKGAAPMSQMFPFAGTFGTRMSLFINTAFPNASPDLRPGTSHMFTAATSPDTTRVTPAHDQAFYPGSPAPSNAQPYNDGEKFNFADGAPPAALTRPAGHIMGAAINENKTPKRVNLGPIAGAVSIAVGLPVADLATAIQDSIAKDRNRNSWPDVGSMNWTAHGASVLERQQQAMFWGINDVATANWYESDSKILLVELREELVTNASPFAILASMPGVPFHRPLAATSSAVKPPMANLSTGVISQDDIMPNGYFQSSFVDDLGGFHQLPLVGSAGSLICYPQVSIESYPDSFRVDVHTIDADAAKVFQLPGKTNSLAAGPTGVNAIDAAKVFVASPSPPHFIALGEAESLGSSISSVQINNIDRRKSGVKDTVVAGMVYVRYRWSSKDGTVTSALSPPLMVVLRQQFNPTWIIASSASGYNSVNPVVYSTSSARLVKTDNSLYLTTKDSSTTGDPKAYWRRGLLVNAPTVNADSVELDVYVDPWLAVWSKLTTGGEGFSSTSYPHKITYSPSGQPMFAGSVKPTLTGGMLKFYIGSSSGSANELPYFSPDQSGIVAEEALEPRPFSVPAVRSVGSYGGRSIAISSDNTIYYSKNIVGAPEFSDELVIRPPPGSGEITALVSFEDQLLMLCRTRIYRLVGQLPDTADSAALDWAIVSSSIGCSNRNGFLVTKFGLLFQSKLGIHSVTPGGDVEFIGKRIIDETSEDCVAMAQMPDEQAVCVFFADKILVLNTSNGTWSKITMDPLSYIVDARTVRDDVYVLLNGRDGGTQGYYSAKLKRLKDVSGRISVAGDEVVSTGWLTVSGANSFQRCTRAVVSGKCSGTISGSATLKVDVYVNESSTVDCTYTFDLESARDSDGNFRVVTYPKTQKMSSISLKVTISSATTEPSAYDTMSTTQRPEVILYGVNFEIVDKGSSTRDVASTSKG